MDIIIQIAEDFSKRHIRNVTRPDDCIDSAQNEVYKIHDPLDKIKFLQVVIEKNRELLESHIKVCRHGEGCQTLINHKKIDYFLCQELKSLGTHKFEDTFSSTDIDDYNQKIEKILSDIETLKDGQRIIYEDLLEELSELKNLYFLGKKKWHQIMLGKVFDMTISGIISETVSKEIIGTINEATKYLSNQ